jgi:acyl-CoA synthetase (AMP-forming)/AMP-acid ligase II
MARPALELGHPGLWAEQLAGRFPDRVALIDDDVPLTFEQFATATRATAAALRDAGVGAGDRVPVVDAAGQLPLATVLGAARIGATAALMNPRLTPPELRALSGLINAGDVTVAGTDHRDGLDGLVLGPEILAREIRSGADDHVQTEAPADAVILFTSGTTGLPKPVPVPSPTLAARLAPYAESAQPSVRLMCVPIQHVGGLIGAFVSLVGGHTLVIQRRFDAGQWLRLVQRHRVQMSFLVPTMLARILDHPDLASTDLSSLASITYGAAPMPAELIERALDALPRVGFVNTFGQTETLGGITLSTPDDHRHPVHRRSVGRLVPGAQVRVVDPDCGTDVAAGEVGELFVLSGQNVADGWLRTGDLVRIDSDGYVYVAGRLADTINRGGEKFGPIEVETVLRAHPAVRDVAVVGVPDPALGERVGAVIVADGVTQSDLQDWCAGRLARYKTPDRIVFADDVPLTDVGKVDRRTVVALLQGS